MKLMVVKDRNVLNTWFLAQFVNDLAYAGMNVCLVASTFSKEGHGVALDSRIRYINLCGGAKHFFSKTFYFLLDHLGLTFLLYRRLIAIERPDVIICYFPVDAVNVLLFAKHAVPVVQMMHGCPKMLLSSVFYKNNINRMLQRRILPRVTCFQVLHNSFRPMVREFFPQANVCVIPNAVVQPPERDVRDLTQCNYTVIYVARIEREGKRQHLAIQAFAQIASRHPQWSLEFWGLDKYPAYHAELEQMIQEHNLKDRICIKGYSKKIRSVYQAADIHLFPSAHEGFSLALADGMAMGLPSIGFYDAPSINELIVNGENGFLVHNVDELSHALDCLMSNQSLRVSMGHKARLSVRQYAPEHVIAAWHRELQSIALR